MILKVRDLSCGYGARTVLQGVNFEVAEQEVVGIIGPNGSGKTTLLRAITRIVKPFQGQISFRGRDIYQVGFQELARNVAVVSQNLPGGFVRLEDFVLLGRTPYFHTFQFSENTNDIEVGKKAMELTDLWKLKDSFLEELSGGERQLASIARALCQEPDLLILDEPTAHLDITHQVVILDLIKRLNRTLGLTVIMVLHDLNLAGEYCDRLILLKNGQIYKDGSPPEVLTYQTIEEVYRTVVVVTKNPVSGNPYVVLVSEEERQKAKKSG